MKRLGRDSTALADHLTALELLAGRLTGIDNPTGTGRVLFAFFAVMAETERDVREATLEGLNTAARKGNHGGRCTPCCAAAPTASPSSRSARTLIITTCKRKGKNPSLASIYRALTEHKKRQCPRR